jgi:uncharacterized membrane protein SirB2
MVLGLMLILGLLLCLAGFLLLQIGLSAARPTALLSTSFWLTFPEYARYRFKRLWPILPGLVGAILLICGLILVFQGILALYAARLGHPLTWHGVTP